MAELEVAWMKDDVDEVDVDVMDREEEAEDVVDGEADWTTSFLGVLLVEDVVEVDVGVDVVVGVEVVLEVSVSVSSTWTGEGVGVGVGVGLGVLVVVVVGDATAALVSSLFLLLLLFELVSSGVAGAVTYPPIGPSNVFAAVW